MLASEYQFNELGRVRYLKNNIYRDKKKINNWKIFELIKKENPHLNLTLSDDFNEIYLIPQEIKDYHNV